MEEDALNHIKQILQSHFTDGLVIIVGSGLSCAEGLPGMGELGSYLIDNVPHLVSGHNLKTWYQIAPIISDVGLETALLQHQVSSELEASISNLTAELISRREQTVISELFSKSRRLRFSSLIPHLLKPNSGIPVVTTNYDRLIEFAVEEAGLGVDTMFCGGVVSTLNEKESRYSFCRNAKLRPKTVDFSYASRVNLFKPHGSLDWYSLRNKPVRYSGHIQDAPRLIITPGKNKFRNGYDSPFDLHRERGNASIDKAVRFLIIGYGFNDDHLETHLVPNIKQGKPTLILTRSLSTVAKDLAANHSNVIALDSTESGTRIILDKRSVEVECLNLWDISEFVRNVLEP